MSQNQNFTIEQVLQTANKLQAHVKSGKVFNSAGYRFREPAPKLVCADGFKMSVQASKSHYCEPRNDEGPYTSFEIWCCTAPVPTLEEHGYDEENNPAGHVPLEVVIELILEHGGIAEGN